MNKTRHAQHITGIELIAQERMRQIEKEGYTDDHDDCHDNEELTWAAIHYATPSHAAPMRFGVMPHNTYVISPCWSFIEPAKKCPTRLHALIKAGALIAAEIDRCRRELDRDAEAASKALDEREDHGSTSN